MILFLLGVLVWSLVEYWLHRGLHIFTSHQHAFGHHAHPQDYSIGPSWIDVGLLAMGIWLLSYGVGALPFAAGVTLAYALYAWAHHAAHHKSRFTPRYLRRMHAVHHVQSRKNFGVAFGLVWDVVFGTYKSPRVPHQAR